MSITHVGTSQGTSSLGVTSRALTVSPGAIGNLLVVAFVAGDGSGSGSPSISDTAVNTWNVCNVENVDATNNSTIKSWFAVANGTGSTTITVQSNKTAQFCSMTLDEFTGNDTSSPLDQHVESADGASGTPISPSFTPGFNDELVWAYAADSITAVGNIDGSAATKGGDDAAQDWSEYRILVGRSGVSMTAAFTGSGAYNVMAATFKPGAASLTLTPGVGSVPIRGYAFDIFEMMRNDARIVIRKS